MNKYDKVVELLNEGRYAAMFSGPALGKHDPISNVIDKVSKSATAKKIAKSKAYQKAKEIGNTDVGKLASKAGKKFKSVAKKLFGKK